MHNAKWLLIRPDKTQHSASKDPVRPDTSEYAVSYLWILCVIGEDAVGLSPPSYPQESEHKHKWTLV